MADVSRQHRSLILGLLKSRKKSAAGPDPRTLCSFEGGLEAIPRALAGSLGPALRLGARVLSLEHGDGWKVAMEQAGRHHVLEARRVVLALPAFGAAELLKPLDAGLAGELASIRYAAVGVVHLGFARNASATPVEGFGMLAPFAEGRRILGAIYASSTFPWRAPADQQLLTCMVGGARRPELVALGEEELVTLAREELKGLVGLDGAPTFSQVFRWPRAIPQYELGHSKRLERIDQRVAALPGLFLTGNAYRGVGINDCVRNAEALAAQLAPAA